MQCKWPGRKFKCGRCLPCYINARRIWSSRILLEASCHEHSVFATLTYETEPKGRTLVKSHLSTTMHRLRERVRMLDREIRFFGVGEYGEIGARPHYHAAIFGIRPDDHHLLQECWNGINRSDVPAKAGFVHIGDVTPDSASYITGYISKKLIKPEEKEKWLAGRADEFAVMSRNPGIGSLSLPGLIEALNTSDGALYMARNHDVPLALQVGGKLMPLGPYIRGKLREFFFGEETQPQSAKDALNARFNTERILTVPGMPMAPQALARIKKRSLEEENALRLLNQKFIHEKEVIRKVRSRQAETRHKINAQRKLL